jgi:hypothetical protein
MTCRCYPQKKENQYSIVKDQGQGQKWLCFLVCDIVCYGHWQPLMNQKLIVETLCFLKELTKGGLRGE